ncbi:uncharacterized protein BX663DRAFT_272264 [Cokeromyces recurvatus]|uniref:uncharacterized protein n=1 Tax=Cokeromyces recurvatus TaxID=90255 RepID=UPI00221F2BCE|nr:uncharacterized protein BX663DRAFT_272264 [Cokeromyces recurvatus]KAI7897998.1 hypothetical protein BX663DRAFT_272264 [Cokeromyces recurvatus]
MPSSSIEYDPLLQFKQENDHSKTGLQIRVLGVPQTGAKSRVETQIKLCIQLVTNGGDKAQWWSHLKLPEHMVTKDKLKKSGINRFNNSTASDTGLPINPEKLLYLQARVLCASDPSKKVTTCFSCIQRERKRSQRRKENKQQQNNDEIEDEKTEDEQAATSDEERILLFNCSEIVDFSAGDTILPTRITCYCRHHNERLGFCIYFEMLDHTGKKVAEGISPAIMITDDHKSNKVKAGLKRRRTENEVVPELKIPALSWIKSSLPFVNKLDTVSPSSSTTTTTTTTTTYNSNNYSPLSNIDDTKPLLKSMLPSTALIQQQQQHPSQQTTTGSQQYLYPLNNSNMSSIQQQQPSSSLPPIMKRLIPNEAPTNGGIEITILGANFCPGLTVMFGDKPATNLQYWSPNTLICTLPPATQPGAVVVSFKESPPTDKHNIMVFTYSVETDRALMELALQVVGMKMTGIVEDARKIAMRIVQGNNNNNNNNSTGNNQLFVSNINSSEEENRNSHSSKLIVKSEPTEYNLS